MSQEPVSENPKEVQRKSERETESKVQEDSSENNWRESICSRAGESPC